MTTTGLVRVTVATPHRRIDLALPERAPLAELLPGLLRHAGVADEPPGGWLLRRGDGGRLDPARTAAAQRVGDGEVLHLVPAQVDWPELEYDDLADVIAEGSARLGGTWQARHTRAAGLAAGSLAALVALAVLVTAGPGVGPAVAALLAAVALVAGGSGLARAFGDSGAGAILAVTAWPFAFVGGALLPAGGAPLTAGEPPGAPQLLAGCASVLVAAVAGLMGVADRAAVFTAGAVAGLAGTLGAWLATADVVPGPQAAAIVAAAALVGSPPLPALAVRLGRLPLPVLPRGPADLLRDTPHPARRAVYASVVRADGILTGLLWAIAAAAAPAQVWWAGHGGTAGVVFTAVLTAGFLLRARLHPIVRHRVPLLLAGATGLASLALFGGGQPWTIAAVCAAATVVVVPAGLRYAARTPTPYLARWGEIVEVLVVVAVVPLLCWVLGLYAVLRGLAG
ncbi:type VII secretion integral membrane protein EccD [Amycolatopsis sp. NBC_00355]|uniref:type VII secretion integral membrane protein EccD n=1 Tax=Amycolatopsis sp. NBC_00355 TaxID=2975957 RepID=UPI002E2671D9